VDQLIEKVNGYVAFIQTGQVYERYPEAADRSLGVRLICVDEPDEAVRQVLAAAAGLFARHDAEFVVEIVPPELVSGLG